MLNLPEKIIIFDTELTCWPGSDDHDWDRPNEYREIVQIGAILIDTKKLIELDYLDILIKPVKNPVLSDYFIDLTGITREEVDKKGISYKEAFPKFISWSKDYNFYSYGGDERILEENCGFAGIPFPFKNSRFVDIRNVFRKRFPDINNYQSGTIMSLFGKKSALRPHNALNDVRILLGGLWELDKIA